MMFGLSFKLFLNGIQILSGKLNRKGRTFCNRDIAWKYAYGFFKFNRDGLVLPDMQIG